MGLFYASLHEDTNPCLPGPFRVISFSSSLSERDRSYLKKVKSYIFFSFLNYVLMYIIRKTIFNLECV